MYNLHFTETDVFLLAQGKLYFHVQQLVLGKFHRRFAAEISHTTYAATEFLRPAFLEDLPALDAMTDTHFLSYLPPPDSPRARLPVDIAPRLRHKAVSCTFDVIARVTCKPAFGLAFSCSTSRLPGVVVIPVKPMTHLLPVEQVVVRLADEGVPLRVIARAVHVPSETIRERLREAQDDGTLVDLPKEDWPPGFPRDQRALQLSRMVVEDRAAVTLALQRVFNLTTTEVTLLMLLLQNHSVPKVRFSMAPRIIDVHICNIRRRLVPFGIAVETLWGYGYQLAGSSRRRIMKHIARHVRVSA